MATRRPTSTPTVPPTSRPTSSPTPYVPVPPPEEIGNLMHPASLPLHVILIMVSMILACIFVGYLGLHLARKYHPEWFKRGSRKKQKKRESNGHGKESGKDKKVQNRQDKSEIVELNASKSSKYGKKLKLMSVKPITLDEETENDLRQSKPKSLSSIVPVRDDISDLAAAERVSRSLLVQNDEKDPTAESELGFLQPNEDRQERGAERTTEISGELEVPEFLKDLESEKRGLVDEDAGIAPSHSLLVQDSQAEALIGNNFGISEGSLDVETGKGNEINDVFMDSMTKSIKTQDNKSFEVGYMHATTDIEAGSLKNDGDSGNLITSVASDVRRIDPGPSMTESGIVKTDD